MSRRPTCTGTPTGFSRGSTIQLVRWQLGRDGWEAEIRAVTYVRRDSSHWTTVTDEGDLVLLARSEWQICEL